MKDHYCVVCGQSLPDDRIVCVKCAKNLGQPQERSERSIESLKIEKRRRRS